MSHPLLARALPALLLLACAACDRGADRPEAPATETVPGAGAAVDGLSPAQIERRAEPMSPERAAELGIIDSTIHVSQEP